MDTPPSPTKQLYPIPFLELDGWACQAGRRAKRTPMSEFWVSCLRGPPHTFLEQARKGYKKRHTHRLFAPFHTFSKVQKVSFYLPFQLSSKRGVPRQLNSSPCPRRAHKAPGGYVLHFSALCVCCVKAVQTDMVLIPATSDPRRWAHQLLSEQETVSLGACQHKRIQQCCRTTHAAKKQSLSRKGPRRHPT